MNFKIDNGVQEFDYQEVKGPRTYKYKDEEITTELSEDEARDMLKDSSNSFARKLSQQKDYSSAQRFWLFKLAEENQPIEPVKLMSNVQEFMEKAKVVMWHMDGVGRIKLYSNENLNGIVKVFVGGGDQTRYVGEIKDEKFLPENLQYATGKIPLQLFAFSIDPLQFMQSYGREFGRCCICGRLLENEESVKLGIGPICLQRIM